VAKNVFKPQEIMYLSRKVFIEPPRIAADEPVQEAETVEEERGGEYSGPTVEELKKEADQFRRGWEQEKEKLLADAQAEALKIRKEAEQVAFDEVKRKNNQAQKIRQDAEDQAQEILSAARQKGAELEGDIKQRVTQTEREAYERGYTEGHAKGYDEGKAEVQRLVESLHSIITRAIDKRNEIIEEAETQIINLVLLIVKKVIKVISENQKNVVINNVVQALRKLKSRGDVVIRVNLADLELTSEHVKDFMKMVENVKSITVLEDSSVDRGGCIIETDFGQIDARISSQLHEIEERILELMPIRSKGE
jgi:flagellar assembly protein FliH